MIKRETSCREQRGEKGTADTTTMEKESEGLVGKKKEKEGEREGQELEYIRKHLRTSPGSLKHK